MNAVVTDTSPLNYLIQIHQAAWLGRLFERVILPGSVLRELLDPRAPALVREWCRELPDWIELRDHAGPAASYGLDAGETEAISLALDLGIQTVIMDERNGRRVAEEHGLTTLGTLTLLEAADARGYLDFESVLNDLRATNFHAGEKLLSACLERVKQQRA